jgi:polysaccharide export outer membrane protein
MTVTYGIRIGSVAMLVAMLSQPGQGQSLEEKVAQARKMQQAQNSAAAGAGGELSPTDSMLFEEASRARPDARSAQRRSSTAKRPDRTNLDSLLSGPAMADSLAEMDTVYADSADSASAKSRPKRRKAAKIIPKRYEQRIFQDLDRSAFSSASGSAGRDYILGPGDAVTVALWGDKEKEYSLILNQDGKIFMEGIGLVTLAGNNLDAGQQLLKQRLAKVYSGIVRGSTHVELSLGRAGPIRVFVLGEVKVPGGYVFSGHSSILSAMYFAKGPTDIGTVRNLQLTRSGNRFSLDLYKYLIRGESLSPQALQDNDILFAARAEALVEVKGDVGRPATYELKKGEGVKELLEFAGGLNPTASAQKLTLRRIFPGGKMDYVELATPQEYLTGKAKMELLDGDKVTVEKSTEPSRNFLTIAGPVKYPGTYDATGITTVNQLVDKAGGLREDAFLGRVHIVRFRPDGSSSLQAYSLDSTVLDSISLIPKDNVLLYSLKEMLLPDSVQITGAVFKPGKYVFRSGMTAMDLVMHAGGYLPHHENGRIIVFRSSGRERTVEQISLKVEDGLSKTDAGFTLHPNDLVQIPVDPRWYQKEVIVLDGLFQHPGKYALLYPGEKLSSVVERAGGFKEDAYIEGGRFYRAKDSVGRVGIDLGQALRKSRSKANIGMVGGDSIFIPARLNTVKVIGEVGFETSLLFQEGATVQYYIEKAGGYTRRSEKDRVVVQYANGETSRDGYFNRKPDAGSVIYVPQGPEPKPIEWFTGINALLGTVGVIAAVILSIQAISKN